MHETVTVLRSRTGQVLRAFVSTLDSRGVEVARRPVPATVRQA